MTVTQALSLRDYQLTAMETILQRHEDAGNSSRQLAVLPTGAGKTVIFSHIAKAIGGKCLILAHRDELIDQAIDKLRIVWPDATIGKLRGSVDKTNGAQVVVASIATAYRDKRLDKLADLGPWATIIVDEAHHAVASSYQKVISRLVSRETLLLGVTATPMRLDGQAIGQVFDEVSVRVPIAQLVDDGYLVDCRLVQVSLSDLDMRDVSTSGGDYTAGDLGRQLAEAGVAGAIAKAYKAHGQGRPAVAYVPTVALAYEVSEAMTESGSPCGVVSGETPMEIRAFIFGQLRSGALKCVANCMVLTEGWDEPSVSCVIVGRPTRSISLYTQMVGRGLRLHPDKADCLVIDVTGLERDPSQATLADLGGDGKLNLGQLAIVREIVALLDQGLTLTEAKRQATEKLGTAEERAALGPSSGHQRDSFNWLRDHKGRYVLSLGQAGVMILFPRNDGAKWAVAHLNPGAVKPWELRKAPVKELARDVELGWAQGIAEELVRRYSTAKISGATVAWRKEAASEGQIGYAERLGVPGARLMTKGVLSDALTLTQVSVRFDKPPSYLGRPLAPPAATRAPTGASWRDAPATPAQLAYAQRLGLDTSAIRTKGEVADAIDAAKAAKASKKAAR